MPKFIHDKFAKQILEEVLQYGGEVETSKEIFSERQEIDVFFTPNPEKAANLIPLGILGKIASKTALIEPFRNAVTPAQIISCMGKLYSMYNQLERESKRQDQKIKNAEPPFLWILTPTASLEIVTGVKGEEDIEQWGTGIYFLGNILKTALVVIHQLPNTPETLWLRMLGKGNVQKKALEELKALSDDNPYKENTLEIVYSLLAVLDVNQQQKQELDPEEQEFIMQLSTVYLERLETERNIGLEQGLTTERRNTIESLLTIKFGIIDRELTGIIPRLLTLTPAEFTPLILQLSREELINRFSA